ncbi:MAG: hypothetical protein WCW16_04495 [Candidatus Magasanikbacteria bacterium]
MFGKPQWFKRRKYGGWGLSPATWQGWVYIGVFLIPFAIFQAFPIWSDSLRIGVTIGWIALLLIDVLHIMMVLKNDERETKIEALAERNAAWAMVAAIVVGLLYQIIKSGFSQTVEIDWFLVITLFAGVIVKGISNVVYERKSL